MKKKLLFTLSTFCILFGVLLATMLEMGPSPFLVEISDTYHLAGKEAQLNLSVSVIFPAIAVTGLLGSALGQKIGLRRLYSLTLLLVAVGTACTVFAKDYFFFLLCRVLYGLGFGLSLPFIETAIVKWYTLSQRETMNTANALLPFVGTLISYCLMTPLATAFRSWKYAIGVWGAATFVVLILWLLLPLLGVLEEQDGLMPAGEAREKGVYLALLKRRDIRILCVMFMCDYISYSYVGVVLPTLLEEIGKGAFTTAEAGVIAAIVFPACGLVGCLLGGWISGRSGLRKPVIIAGQIIKFAGLLLATVFAKTSLLLAIVGFALFGLGNAIWMPPFYCAPMEMKGMSASMAGAAFALMNCVGFICGLIAPSVGGILTDALSAVPAAAAYVTPHSYGVVMSLVIFNVFNLLSIIYSLFLTETGPRAKIR